MLDRSGYRDVEPLLRPQSITIVGASENPASWSARIFHNLSAYGFPGAVHLVNPRYRELYGSPCYPSVQEVPGPLDQLVIIIPAHHVPEVIDQAGARGCRSAVVFSGGFSEANTAAGNEAEKEMVAAAEHHGIRIGGPNCLGNVSTREHVLTLAEFGVELFRAGGLALVSQSSGLMGGMARYAMMRGLGLSYCAASGSEANTDAADYLNFLAADDSTRVIALVLEAVRRPAEFALACERARTAGKPVLVLKIGTSPRGQAAALSHTGALAGSYEAFAAFRRRYGAVEVRGFDEAVDTAELFLRCPPPRGRGVAAIALSGGGRGYLHDLEDKLGIEFPVPATETLSRLEEVLGVGSGAGNPLDLGAAGAGNPDAAFRCLQLFANEPDVGLIAAQGDLPHGPESAARTAGFEKMIAYSRQAGKPIIFYSRASHPVSPYGTEFRDRCGAPFLQEIGKCFQAIANFMSFWNWTPSGRPRQDPAPRGILPEANAVSTESQAAAPISDAEGFTLIQQAGLEVAPYELCASLAAAERAAEHVGYPVALKPSVPGLTHKMESGGVLLNLGGPCELASAFAVLQEKLAPKLGSCFSVMVQKMIPGPLELFAGARLDPEFGPLVLFGLGGLFVEAGARVATRLAPVQEPEAEEMILESGVSHALRRLGAANAPGKSPLISAIVRLSQLIARRDELKMVEINPLIFQADNPCCIAVDVVAIFGHNAAQPSR